MFPVDTLNRGDKQLIKRIHYKHSWDWSSVQIAQPKMCLHYIANTLLYHNDNNERQDTQTHKK